LHGLKRNSKLDLFIGNEEDGNSEYLDSYIVVVSFIGGGNRRIRRKPPTCGKSLTNFIT
jgi:hypothetical protein